MDASIEIEGVVQKMVSKVEFTWDANRADVARVVVTYIAPAYGVEIDGTALVVNSTEDPKPPPFPPLGQLEPQCNEPWWRFWK